MDLAWPSWHVIPQTVLETLFEMYVEVHLAETKMAMFTPDSQ